MTERDHSTSGIRWATLLDTLTPTDPIARILTMVAVIHGVSVSFALTENVHHGSMSPNILTIIIPIFFLIAGFGFRIKIRRYRSATLGFGMGGAIGPVIYGLLVIPRWLATAGPGPSLLGSRYFVIPWAIAFVVSVEMASWQMSSLDHLNTADSTEATIHE